ncbi:MAG: choice-of-anchor tandem repeat GloVer-containing protein [Bacteroidales bacterium]
MKKLLLILLIAICGIANAQYTKLLDFGGAANGQHPHGSFISDGTFLYGMTEQGGTNGYGTIFKIKPDGTEDTVLHSFGYNDINGSEPMGDLVYDGTFLYGMTYQGGTNNLGVIFKVKPDGTGYAKLLDFSGTANGNYPNGSLIYDGTFLYGMAFGGGTNGDGVIFKIKPDGTGYSKLLDFAGAANGQGPPGSLISDGTFLYGMTQTGGTSYMGVIFKIKHDGTGYAKLLDFSGANGNVPTGSLFYDGTFLYGMTNQGGTNGDGVIFKIKPDGTGYAKLLDFSGTANGSFPWGSLISDGTFLYGMTSYGGSNGVGVIFKIKPDGTGYSDLFDFANDNVHGYVPLGSLISDGSFLYGMASSGGTNGVGVIFKYGIAVGIAENNAETDFTIYPNPATDNLTIECPQQTVIEILNIQGQLIKILTANGNKTSVDVSAFPNGVYIVKVEMENGIMVMKFVRE